MEAERQIWGRTGSSAVFAGKELLRMLAWKGETVLEETEGCGKVEILQSAHVTGSSEWGECMLRETRRAQK